MLRRSLVLSTLLAVVAGLLALAAPAHAAPVSPNVQIFVDVWNESPTREYGTYVPITVQTEATNGFDGVPGSYVVWRNGVQVSSGWSSRGSWALSLMPEDPAGTYVIETTFTPDDSATYLPETKSVTIERPKATTSLDLGNPTTDVSAGTSWTLPEANPVTARVAVRSGSTAGACAATARRVNFTGAGTCTIDVTAEEDANHFAATPQAVTFQVTQTSTVTALTWSAEPVVVDEQVDLQIALKAGADPVDGIAEVWVDGVRTDTVITTGGGATWRTSFASPGLHDVEVHGIPLNPAYAGSVGTTSIQVNRQTQTISAPPSPAYVGDTWRPTASGDGSVTVTSSTTTVCDVVDGQVTFRATGTCQVDSSVAATTSHDASERSDSFSVVGVPVTVDVTVVALTAGTQRVDLEVSSVRGTPSGTVSLNGRPATALVDGRASYETAGGVPGQTLHAEVTFTPTPGSKWAAGTTVSDPVIPKVPQPVTISEPPVDPRLGQTWTPTITFTDTPMATSWQASGACARDGAVVSFTAVGDCTVSARHAGNEDYLEGTATRTFAVGKVTRTFSASPTPAYVDDTWSPTVSGPGAVTATSTTPAVCTASGGTVTFRAAGSCTVDLSAAETAEHEAATTRRTVAVTRVPVTATVVGIARADRSPLTVTFTSPRGTPTGVVDLNAPPAQALGAQLVDGVATLYLDGPHAPRDTYNLRVEFRSDAARWADLHQIYIQPFRGEQTVRIAAPAQTARVGETWTPDIAWDASGMPKAWGAAGACVRESAAVRFTAVGDCTLTAVQSSSTIYFEGRDEIVVPVHKGRQAISLGTAAPGTGYVGRRWAPQATGGPSGQPLDITAAPGTTCDLVASTEDGVATPAIRFRSAGDCTVTFAQQGTADYEPGELVVTIPVERRTATLIVDLPSTARVGEPAVVTARSDEEGTVRFALDGEVVGTPVALTGGAASVTLVPKAGGERVVTATFLPAAPTEVDGVEREVTLDVDRAPTGTALSVEADRLTATVTPTHAAAGVPTGEVTFVVDGVEADVVRLVAGRAVLPRDTATDADLDVRATYSGSADHEPSTATTVRTNPGITAHVSSSAPVRAGWYTGPVVVRFTCTGGSAALVDPCPAPVRLERDGVAQPLTRSVTTRDGGRASVRVDGIRIDSTAPQVRVDGARDGATYRGKARTPRCAGSDVLSGLAGCQISQRRTGPLGYEVTATATDVAGNTTTRTLRYRITRTWLVDRSTGPVVAVRRGSSPRLATLGRTRPTVRTSWGARPRVWRHSSRAGLPRWKATLRIPRHARIGTTYVVRVRMGGEVTRLRLRVVR